MELAQNSETFTPTTVAPVELAQTGKPSFVTAFDKQVNDLVPWSTTEDGKCKYAYKSNKTRNSSGDLEVSTIMKTDCGPGYQIKYMVYALTSDWENMLYYYYQADGAKRSTDTQKLLENCRKLSGGRYTMCDVVLKEFSDAELATSGLTQKMQNSAGFMFPPGSYGFRGVRIRVTIP